MTEVGQCRICGQYFAIGPGGHFKRKHGSRIARCPGHRQLAVGHGPAKQYSKSPIIKHSIGKV